MAFMKIAKFSIGGLASVIGLSSSGLVVQAKQETEKNENVKVNEAPLPNVYFILKQGNSLIGTIVMELRSDIAPITAENFRKSQI